MNLSKKAQIGKKKTSKKLIKELDKAVSDAVLLIDKNIPWDFPPCKGFLCNNHFIRRGMYKVRFHPLNCYCGTSGGNYRHEENANYMISWFIGKYGAEVYRELFRYSIGEAKWKSYELESLIEFWKGISSAGQELHRNQIIIEYMEKFRKGDQIELARVFKERFCGKKT